MASITEISNDGRGWIMTALSGVACVFGASFINIDLVVRQFPGKRNFNLRESSTFLALSLSLSSGVMLFSALFSMLPSAKSSLQEGGHSAKKAAWILIACFIGGIVGIQILSRAMHHFLPHDVVPCDHTHEDEEARKEGATAHHEHDHDHDHDHDHNHAHINGTHDSSRRNQGTDASRRDSNPQMQQRPSLQHLYSEARPAHGISELETARSQPRPTLKAKISNTFARLTSGQDDSCDCDGACRGYSDLCESGCFKNAGAKGGIKIPKPTMGVNRPSAIKVATATESTPLLHGIPEEPLKRPHTRTGTEHLETDSLRSDLEHRPSSHSSATLMNETTDGGLSSHKGQSHDVGHASSVDSSQPSKSSHHHHIPQNQFAAIGMQTCIAIALHKLPEGFITYATNHANPKLGVSVFLALFIHNITEGFVMALPLYLAINNRVKAMLITFGLGGLSQPLGAGVAALWLKLAGKSGWTPSEAGYGCMFAITAGILASVALQLYAEAVGKGHSKTTCLLGAIIGMAILGCSSALTA